MRLCIMFAKWPDDALMPNAMAVVDNYMEDEWGGGIPDPYLDECEKIRSKCEPGTQFVEAFIEVPDAAIRALFEPKTIRVSDEALTKARDLSDG